MTDCFSNETPKKNRLLTSMINVAVFFAASAGIPLDRIIKLSGLNPQLLMDPDSYSPQKFYLNVLRQLNGCLKEGDVSLNVSLQLVKALPLAFLGSPGKLILQAPDLQTMLDMFVRNSDLFSDQFELELINREGGEMLLRMYHPLDDIDDGLGGEVAVGLSVRIGREFFGTGVLAGVQFKHEARSPVMVYEDFFGVPVAFSAPFNGLIFRKDTLERKNKKPGSVLHGSIKSQLIALRRTFGLSDEDELADIRDAVARNAEKGDYSVQGLAQCMGMSIRSLQLRMQSTGVNARSLLEEARYAKALELLCDKNLCVDEVAEQVGFSCERSFRRAFERWTQKSPAQARREINGTEPHGSDGT